MPAGNVRAPTPVAEKAFELVVVAPPNPLGKRSWFTVHVVAATTISIS
jgi:hypothetical protein